MKNWDDYPDDKKPLLLLFRQEMADLYGVSKAMISRWAKAGLLPEPKEFLGKPVWEAIDIVEWEKRGMTASPTGNFDYPMIFKFDEPPAPKPKTRHTKIKEE